MKKSFVIMPFHEDFKKHYHLVYKPALQSAGYSVTRVDEILGSRPIIEDIQEAIKRADLILCDMSTRNPNVFYELGLAHAIGKPVILVSNNIDDVPFDLRHVRTIIYNNKQAGWDTELKQNIIAFATDSQIGEKIYPEPLIAFRKSQELFADEIGIVKIFKNFEESTPEILEQIGSSNSVRIFLQLGKTVLAGTTIYDYLGKNVKMGATVKVLNAGLDSPYLKQRIALERGSNYDEWVADLNHAMAKIKALTKSSYAYVRSRQHKESYLWLIFLFDSCAYIQPYMFIKNNTKQSPVIKIEKNLLGTDVENPRSLYKTFSTYFDIKWEECIPQHAKIEDIAEEHTTERNVAVAAILKHQERYIFTIPARYIQEGQSEIKFHAIGGKKEKNENWINALLREIKEETHLTQIEVVSSRFTKYMTSNANLSGIDISDNPKPYCIYKRTQSLDTTLPAKSVMWLVGYETKLTLNESEQIKPFREAGCILYLTEKMLKATAEHKVSINDIEFEDDGSAIVLREDLKINKNARLIPSGLAGIIATELT